MMQHDDGSVLPVPTAWPMVLALGIALTIAGMVTHWVISLLGVVLALRSTVGWFFEVLPHEHHASVPVHADEIVIIDHSKKTRAGTETRPKRIES
jgi:hypothetical protein